MREFIENRGQYILDPNINISPDYQLSREKIIGILNKISDTGQAASDAVDFLENHIDEIESSINQLLDAIITRINYLSNTITSASKAYITKSATAKSIDVKILDISRGKHENMSYSVYDNGLILGITNRTTFS